MVHRFYRPVDLTSPPSSLRDELPAFLPVLADAAEILGARLDIRSEDDFWLDGHPASIKMIIIEANAKRARYAMKPIPYPGVNAIHQRDGIAMRLASLPKL